MSLRQSVVTCKISGKRLVRIKSIYRRLWSFGIRSLRFRECGLYEASDLLLGDHLSEKSDTVKWLDVSMPHKRNRRLKDHRVLKVIAEHNPDTEDIFEDNLIDTFYPQRPQELEDVCLYDFVANYDWQGRDDQGRRKYKRLTKARLPNHKLFFSRKCQPKRGVLLLSSTSVLSIQG